MNKMLNLRQIEVFRAIMSTGSVSAASKVLMVSQPAVSRMLSHAEQRVGFTLFERIKGRLHPSPEARRLFREVEVVYRDLQRVNSTLHDIKKRQNGMLRIAVSSSIGHQVAPWAIAGFLSKYESHVSLDCLTHSYLKEQILDRKVDLAVSLFPVNHPNIEVIDLYHARMLCVCRKSHAIASKHTVTLAEICDYNLIGYPETSPFGRHIRSAFEFVGEPWKPTTEVDAPYYACALAEAGVGVALVDEFTWNGWSSTSLKATPLPKGHELNVSLAYHCSEPLSQLSKEFVKSLRQALEKYKKCSHAVKEPLNKSTSGV